MARSDAAVSEAWRFPGPGTYPITLLCAAYRPTVAGGVATGVTTAGSTVGGSVDDVVASSASGATSAGACRPGDRRYVAARARRS